MSGTSKHFLIPDSWSLHYRMTEIMTADVDTQTPPDVSSDFVTTDDNEDELLHDISQDLQVHTHQHIFWNLLEF